MCTEAWLQTLTQDPTCHWKPPFLLSMYKLEAQCILLTHHLLYAKVPLHCALIQHSHRVLNPLVEVVQYAHNCITAVEALQAGEMDNSTLNTLFCGFLSHPSHFSSKLKSGNLARWAAYRRRQWALHFLLWITGVYSWHRKVKQWLDRPLYHGFA